MRCRYLPFSRLEDKSPRTRQENDAISALLKREDERLKRLDLKVEKHERMAANERIAKLAIRTKSC
jgi:hypothetical protein